MIKISLCFSKTIVNGGDGENDGKEEIHVVGDDGRD
jgi:hypothetical protein